MIVTSRLQVTTAVCDSTRVGPHALRESEGGGRSRFTSRYANHNLAVYTTEHSVITKKVATIRDAFLSPEVTVLIYMYCVTRQVAR
jgi:hypothetical protein